MSEVRIIRESLGMSQYTLAEVLGVSRSVVSMAELGKRPLPTFAVIKLGELHVKPSAEIIPDPELPENVKTAIKNHRDDLVHQLERKEEILEAASKKLARWEKLNASSMDVQILLEKERQFFEGLETYSNELNKRSASAKKFNEMTHPEILQILRFRISLLNASIPLYRNELQRIDSILL